MMSFGDFDELDFLKNQSIHSLAGRTFISSFFHTSVNGLQIFFNFSNSIFNALFRDKALISCEISVANVQILITFFKSRLLEHFNINMCMFLCVHLLFSH